ncbi:MAG: glycerophosphodiester phosphodiesterase family protein, partial [Arenicellales bacterium]
MIHGHRGARGLAPENTLTGFACASAIGVHGLELDVLISADEKMVVHHDPCLSSDLCRDPFGNWLETSTPAIYALTEAQLRIYDVGTMRPGSSQEARFPSQQGTNEEPIPMFSDLVGWWQTLTPYQPVLNIELKSDPRYPDESPDPDDYARIVVGELKQWHLLTSVWLQAFDWRLLQSIQRLSDQVFTGYLSSERNHDATVLQEGVSPWLAGFDPCHFSSSLPEAIKAAGGRFWGPAFADLSKERVQEAQTLGLS